MNSTPRRPTLGDGELTLSGVLKLPTLDGNRISLTSALQLSMQVVRLVAESHDQGKVVGVLDAAHLVCSSAGNLTFGGKGGNPIAPELKRGEMPDRLTDVYALGALMYRLLTGRRVEQARIIEPPSHFNPAVDSGLDDLVLAALDEDPSERPYSARDLEERLLGVYDELGLEAESKTEAVQLIKQTVSLKPKRHPTSEAPTSEAPTQSVPPRRQPVFAKVDPELTLDSELPDDADDDWQPQLQRNPLEKKWLIGGVAVLALFLIAVVAWPSGKKKETLRSDDDVPAKVVKTTAPAPAAEPAVQAKLIEAPDATPMKIVKKKVESPKKSTRRARR